MFKALQLSFLPRNVNFGLLVLRLWTGLTLLFVHGAAKISNFSQTAPHFSDPLHVGHTASLALATFGEAVCSLLVAIGLATRFAALCLVIEFSVIFVSIHKMALSGQRSGELPFIYLGAFLAILIAGPGRFSVDGALDRGTKY